MLLACILKRNLDSQLLLREDLDDYQLKRFYEPQEINKSSPLLDLYNYNSKLVKKEVID